MKVLIALALAATLAGCFPQTLSKRGPSPRVQQFNHHDYTPNDPQYQGDSRFSGG